MPELGHTATWGDGFISGEVLRVQESYLIK